MAASSSAGPSQTPSAAPQWRQFTFFDSEDVKDAEDLSSSPRAFKNLTPPVVVTTTSQGSPLPASVIVSSGNSISILDRHFTVTKNFKAWEGNGRGNFLVEAGGLLVSIGEEDGSRYPVLKIWDLTRDEKKKAGGGPVLVRNVRIQYGQRPHPVSALAVTSNLSHLAIGLGDGTVLLYRHLLQSLQTSPTALTSLPKARVIHESPEPITGLGFRESGISSATSRAPESDKINTTTALSLFIVTVNRVLSAPIGGKGTEAKVIDEIGCGLGCAVMDWDKREMILARDEAIYLYGPEGRGACYAYEGPKSSITIWKQNLIIISPPFTPSAASASATVRHYVSKNNHGDLGISDIAKVTIFDLANKIISYSGTYREGVRDVFAQWGGVYVYGGNGKLARLDEHSTSAKLDLLYRRNLYTLAINLAKASGMNEAGIAGIYKKYGDYLYGKGDFEGSMSQFVQTLGSLQPSYVIRKFLDAQRIHNLTTFLQELHSRGLANPDHTTLLLNCYTKTGDRNRLDTFIKTEAKRSDEAGGSGTRELPFDLDTAIKVCRQAGFYEHATYLARKYGRHEDFLRIQIEDAREYDDALKYLRSLGPEACQENMAIYGKILLEHVPEATTDLFIELCGGTLGEIPPPGYALTDTTKAQNGSAGPAVLSYLGYNRVAGMFSGESPATQTSATVPDGTSNEKNQPNGQGTEKNLDEAIKDAIKKDEEPSYIPPSPQIYFAHFLDHQPQFIRFLESVAQTRWSESISSEPREQVPPFPKEEEDLVDPDKRAIWNTLLELYLTTSQSITLPASAKKKALSLLRSDLEFDPMHALILCSTAGFTEGSVCLYERLGLYEDVLRFYMAQPTTPPNPPSNGEDTVDPGSEVLRYLNLYGPTNPQLYPLVLRYLTSSPDILTKHSSQLGNLLQTIDELHIMPPLAIVQLLSRNGVASVGSVKSWLRNKVVEGRQDVLSDKSLVTSYRSETESKQKDIIELANPKQPEVFQVTRCAACGSQLDLPSVHFMCKHSYHQRCLSDSDPECILCARQHSVIRELRRNQTRLASRHDLFLSEVHEAEDGVAVVAGAYGRGLMGKNVE